MQKNSPKKPKVNLSDYSYEQDIEHRVQMTSFSPFEVNLLEIILNGSLTISFEELMDELEVGEEKLLFSLEKFEKIKLLNIQNRKIIINKEKRKYFELHIARFETDFEPTLEFLQGLLNQVPIHILPSWYVISKTSSHILQSIIERHLLTLRNYEKHLEELKTEEPLLYAIAQDVFSSDDLTLPISSLKNKYNLDEQEIGKCILQLEYNLLCCAKYEYQAKGWKEYLIPFHEWGEILRFRKETQPRSIIQVDDIQHRHPFPFGFIHDLSSLIRHLEKQNLEIQDLEKEMPTLLPHLPNLLTPDLYCKQLIQHILKLDLTKSKEWLKKDIENQAFVVYQNSLARFFESQELFTDRDIREILRYLKQIHHNGWIYYEDFLRGFCAPIGQAAPATLTLKGKKWRYALPTYSSEEKALIKSFIFHTLLEGGLVSTGTFEGKECFCITSFGYHVLEDYF